MRRVVPVSRASHLEESANEPITSIRTPQSEQRAMAIALDSSAVCVSHPRTRHEQCHRLYRYM